MTRPPGTLADQQAALVRALVAGAPVPPGFSERAVTATSAALLRKRASEVARVWPELARAHAPRWPAAFAAWAKSRPPQGSLADGWRLAHDLAGTGLPDAARIELLAARTRWRQPNRSAVLRARRLPCLRYTRLSTGKRVLIAQFWGRIKVLLQP